MTINFEQLLPEGTREEMINKRVEQLAAEGLANQLAKTEAEARGNLEEVAQYDQNILIICASIQANQAQLPQ
jgi:hypothetical protein